jgi:hypothetical protein
MTDRDLIDQLADALIRKAISSGWLRTMLQEIVLRTMIAHKYCDKMGEARAFLECCLDRSIRVRLNRQTGKLVTDRPLPPDLAEMAKDCRAEVRWYLERHGELMGAIFPDHERNGV